MNRLVDAGLMSGFAIVELLVDRTLEESRTSPGTLKAADEM
jgi:hypothetical protein